MDKRDKILMQHKYPIWQGANARWDTYLPDDTKRMVESRLQRVSENRLKMLFLNLIRK